MHYFFYILVLYSNICNYRFGLKSMYFYYFWISPVLVMDFFFLSHFIKFCCIKIVLCMIHPYFTFENVYTIICSTFHPCFRLLFWLSPMHLVNAVISDWHTCDVVYHQKASYSFFTTIPVATMYLLTLTPEGAYC